MADRPRPFDEVVAAERERFDRAKNYRDRAVEHDFHADVWLVSDRHEKGVWRVEYQDDDGGCYVTIFTGPASEKRARDYFASLKSGRLEILRDPLPQ